MHMKNDINSNEGEAYESHTTPKHIEFDERRIIFEYLL